MKTPLKLALLSVLVLSFHSNFCQTDDLSAKLEKLPDFKSNEKITFKDYKQNDYVICKGCKKPYDEIYKYENNEWIKYGNLSQDLTLAFTEQAFFINDTDMLVIGDIKSYKPEYKIISLAILNENKWIFPILDGIEVGNKNPSIPFNLSKHFFKTTNNDLYIYNKSKIYRLVNKEFKQVATNTFDNGYIESIRYAEKDNAVIVESLERNYESSASHLYLFRSDSLIKMNVREYYRFSANPTEEMNLKGFMVANTYDKNFGKYGYKTRDGKIHSLFDLTDNGPSSLEANYTSFVKKGNKHALYDYKKKGMLITDFEYDSYNWFSEGLSSVKKENKWGYINAEGTTVIPFQFDDAKAFSDNLAVVKLNESYGYINKEGKMVILNKYEAAYDFTNGLAIVTLNKKFGIIDHLGKTIVPFKYDMIDYFTAEGLALVKLSGKCGFINKSGKEIIPCKYEFASSFISGKASVRLEGKSFYIDNHGKPVK